LYFGKRCRDGMEAARHTGVVPDARVVRDAGGVGDGATSRGGQSVECASSFRNEFAGVKADDVRPGRLRT
jgi:hypothetical protein